jgi:hypothetical protein
MLIPVDARRIAATLFPQRGIGVEIGVHLGDFSKLIVTLARPKKLTLIDPWRYRREPQFAETLYGGATVNQKVMDQRYQKVLQDFDKHIEQGMVEVLRATSREAVKHFEDGTLDFVYIDGDHRYTAVAEDIRLYWPKIKAGGVLVGDDYRMNANSEGVTKAFGELLSAPDIFVEFKIGSQIGIRKPEGSAASVSAVSTSSAVRPKQIRAAAKDRPLPQNQVALDRQESPA